MRIAPGLRTLLLAALVVACNHDDPTAPLVDLGGAWTGANAFATVDVTLSNLSWAAYCAELVMGCRSASGAEFVRLRGTYRNARSGEVIELVSYMQRRRETLVVFDLYERDDFAVEPERPTYATTRLVGQLTSDSTIEATLFTEYQRSSGGASVSWTTWSGDSSTITLHRR